MRATLALDDGLVVTGDAIGAQGSSGGEVVFTTSMTGYQEILTDPSFRGQIIVMAYPLIGNYGFDDRWSEAKRPQASGIAVRWAAPAPGRADGSGGDGGSLDDYLRSWGIAGIAGVDTRRLVRHLRTGGVRRGVITTDDASPGDLTARAQAVPDLGEVDLVAQVSTSEIIRWPGEGPRIAVLDCGAKEGIVRNLSARGCEVVVVPHNTSAQAISALGPAGLVISNGPGDPARLGYIAEEVRHLWDELPIMGICLGHQILAMAAGACTFKLPYGHRGSNHPVRDETTGRVAVTTQNHGYAVEERSLQGTGFEVTHRNLHDETVEGMHHRALPIFSVQYHPEGRPGPRDSSHLFDRFLQVVRDHA